MTLEEMCKALGHAANDCEEVEYDTLVAIEKALRAGQAMRDTFDIIGDTTEVNHKALARKGSAYDKLMKGDDK